jgi:hypothetical protein
MNNSEACNLERLEFHPNLLAMKRLVSLSLDNSKPPSFFFALTSSQLNRLLQVNQCQAISFQSNDHMRHRQWVVEGLLALLHMCSLSIPS